MRARRLCGAGRGAIRGRGHPQDRSPGARELVDEARPGRKSSGAFLGKWKDGGLWPGLCPGGRERRAGTPRSLRSRCSLSSVATSRTPALFRVFRAASSARSGPSKWIRCSARSTASVPSSRPHGLRRPCSGASRSLWRKRFNRSWLRSSSAARSTSRAAAARASVLRAGARG